jgi:diguanylate cyclase (GGDEF)-like protein/PAS domain S-box-containing protein
LKIFETVHRRKDGSDYNVEVRLQLIDGKEQHKIVVFANDITERTLIEKRLKQSEEKFRKIAESSQVGIVIYQDHIIYANQACVSMSGYTLDELYTMPIWAFAEASMREHIKEMTVRRLKGENFPQEYEDFKFRTKDGVEKMIRAMTQTIRYEEGYAGLVTIMDITDLCETKKQLNLLGQAVEQTDDLIKITNRDGYITYVNDSMIAHSGFKRSELIGKNPRIFKSGEHDAEFFENLWQTILSGKTFRNTFINRRKDRSIVYEEETITPIQDRDGRITHFVATGKNVTEQILMEQELTKRATIDMLTDIYNRDEANRHIDMALNQVKRYGEQFGILMLDIDHFKQVNDEYGHDVGDEVLKTFSKIVSLHIRKSDIFARWGGEEFVIISPHLDDGALEQFAEKLRVVIGACEFPHVGTMNVSIGVTEFTPDDTKKSLLKRVDEALYTSKAKGRDCVTYAEA